MIYDGLIDALNNFNFLTSCNSACKLIIITGGRGITAVGLLRKHLAEVGNIEGLDAVVINLANACAELRNGINPYISCSMPTIGEGLNDQEKCLAYLNGIQLIIGLTGSNANAIGGAYVEGVCLELANAAEYVEQAVYALMEQ